MARHYRMFLFLLAFAAIPPSLRAQPFTRVTTGNIVATDGGSTVGSYVGASWMDYNGDGRLDLFVNRVGLYRNDGGGAFTKFTLPFSDLGSTFGNSWADLDNDGDLDCFISAGDPSGSTLFRNDGNDLFVRVTDGDIGASLSNKGWGTAWADYDNDGYVDLVIAAAFGFAGITTPNRLFHNNGDGTFTRIDTGVVVTGTAPYTIPTWVDFDQDGDMDLTIGGGPADGTTRPDYIYRNMLTETGVASFTRVTTGALATDTRDGQIFNWIDYDNDGDLDVYITNYGGGALPGLKNDLYRNDGGSFTKITTGAIANDVAHSLASVWQDFDNDGDLDCLVTNDGPSPNRYYENNGDGTFTSITTGTLVTLGGPHFGASAADYDGDGDVDLYVTGVGLPASNTKGLFRNDLPAGNSWLHVRCTGTVSNRAAIGARIHALALIHGALVWQMREVSAQNSFNGQNDLTAYFGLGDATQVDSLRIEWPSGHVDRFSDLTVNRLVQVLEGDTGSVTPAAPGDGDLNQLPILRFRWERGRYTPPFRLQVSTDSTFGGGFVLDDSLLVDTTRDVAVTENNSTYFWRVRPALDIHAERWSPTRRVRNQIVPPALVFPPEGASFPSAVALRWGSVGGATSYDAQVATDTLFITNFIEASETPDTTFDVDSLVLHSAYFWRVRARSVSAAGDWSVPRRFEAESLRVTVRLRQRWNLVSVPVSLPSYDRDTLFPGLAAGAYAFDPDSGYNVDAALRNLRGYWMKSDTAVSREIAGGSTEVSTALRPGWNLIGPPDHPVPALGLATEPDGILASPVFGYAPGYAAADTLVPGEGYWVKASQGGRLLFAGVAGPAVGAAAATSARISAPSMEAFSTLVVHDAGGNEQTLYLGGGDEVASVDWWELPPVPPAGVFDARFAAGTLAALSDGHATRELPLRIVASFPVTFAWAVHPGLDVSLLVAGEPIRMLGTGSITLTRPAGEIRVRLGPSGAVTLAPASYALLPNYPNPFNPSTTLRFDAPEAAARVRLSIYDMLGREVALLYDGIPGPGRHSVAWSPADLPAGVYFGRLTAEGSTLTTKLMVLK